MSIAVNQKSHEPASAKVTRFCKNAITKVVGKVKVAETKTKMQYKNFQIQNHKKRFGIKYLDLFQDQASDDTLDTCVEEALSEIAVLESEISSCKDHIIQLKRKVSERTIGPPPSFPSSASLEEDVPEPTSSEPTCAKPLFEATTGTEAPVITPSAPVKPTE